MLFHRSRAFDAKIHSNSLAFPKPFKFQGKNHFAEIHTHSWKGSMALQIGGYPSKRNILEESAT
jgi:hypothetical protein